MDFLKFDFRTPESLCHNNKKPGSGCVITTASGFPYRYLLWFQIRFIEIRGIKENGNVDLKALAQLMNQAQLHGIVGAIDDIADGRLGHSAFHIKLILCHISLAQELFQTGTDRLV